MLEAYKVEPGQRGLGRQLRQYSLNGIQTVAVQPGELLHLVIGNRNLDGSSRLVGINLDTVSLKVGNITPQITLLEQGMIQRIQLSNEERQMNPTIPRIHHLYDQECPPCQSGKGHIIRVDNLTTGETGEDILRIMKWDDLLLEASKHAKISGWIDREDAFRFHEQPEFQPSI